MSPIEKVRPATSEEAAAINWNTRNRGSRSTRKRGIYSQVIEAIDTSGTGVATVEFKDPTPSEIGQVRNNLRAEGKRSETDFQTAKVVEDGVVYLHVRRYTEE